MKKWTKFLVDIFSKGANNWKSVQYRNTNKKVNITTLNRMAIIKGLKVACWREYGEIGKLAYIIINNVKWHNCNSL